MSNALWPHGLQHARPPCPSPAPRVYSNSCPLSQWCHPTISPSVIPFSSRLLSFPASGSFPVSQLFTSGGQSIGVSASASVLPMNTQDGCPLGWTGWISLSLQGTLKSLLQHHSSKAPILLRSAFSIGQLSHPYMTTGKTIALTRWTFIGKVMSLLFNMLSRLVIIGYLVKGFFSPFALLFYLKEGWKCTCLFVYIFRVSLGPLANCRIYQTLWNCSPNNWSNSHSCCLIFNQYWLDTNNQYIVRLPFLLMSVKWVFNSHCSFNLCFSDLLIVYWAFEVPLLWISSQLFSPILIK